MKAIKFISLSIFFLLFFVTGFAQLKMKKEGPVVTTTTPKVTDISDQFILQNVGVKIYSNDMSVDAMAHYNMGMEWHKSISIPMMLATMNGAWFNNNQLKQKNGIYIYKPITAVTNMLLNKTAVFSLKDLEQKGPGAKGTYQMSVFGFVNPAVKPAVTQTWRAAFTFQLKFSNGKTTIYKYVKIPEKIYIIGDTHNTNIDFTAADVIAGNANYPEAPQAPAPVIH